MAHSAILQNVSTLSASFTTNSQNASQVEKMLNKTARTPNGDPPSMARSAFLGRRDGLVQQSSTVQSRGPGPVGHQKASINVKASYQPGFVIRRHMDPLAMARRQAAAARAAQAAMVLSPWVGRDCSPASQSRPSWGRQRGRFQRAPLEQNLNRILTDMMRESPRGHMGLRRGQSWDVVEDKDAWVLQFELPGFGAEDVKVQVEDDNVLVICAKLNEDEEADQFRSRRRGTFDTKLRLPDTVQIDGIKAELKKGILAVTLPKVVVEEKKPKVVNIQVNDTSSAGAEAVEAVDTEVVSSNASEKAGSGPESVVSEGENEAKDEPKDV